MEEMRQSIDDMGDINEEKGSTLSPVLKELHTSLRTMNKDLTEIFKSIEDSLDSSSSKAEKRSPVFYIPSQLTLSS